MQDKLLSVIAERESKMIPVGMSIATGDPVDPTLDGIWDNYCVKRQMLALCPILAQQLLLVDEVIRAGKQMK